jgi:hypothetical protein
MRSSFFVRTLGLAWGVALTAGFAVGAVFTSAAFASGSPDVQFTIPNCTALLEKGGTTILQETESDNTTSAASCGDISTAMLLITTGEYCQLVLVEYTDKNTNPSKNTKYKGALFVLGNDLAAPINTPTDEWVVYPITGRQTNDGCVLKHIDDNKRTDDDN